MRIIKSFIPIPDIIYKYIKLYRLNRFLQDRFFHIIKNQYPKIMKCNICEWQGRIFLNNTRCPLCFSLPRHRFLGYILHNIELFDKRILLIGPDMPEILLFNKKSTNNIKILSKEETLFTDIVSDITNHKLKNNSFDLIIMWHVLEHILEDKLAVENIFHLLRSNGIFLFSVPIYPLDNKRTYIPTYENLDERALKTGHPDHVFCCGEDYGDRFNYIGFMTNQTIMARNYIPTEIEKYDLDINHFAWLFTK